MQNERDPSFQAVGSVPRTSWVSGQTAQMKPGNRVAEHHPKDAAEPTERQLGLPIFLVVVATFALTFVLVILR
jgi:hypothetical protein